MIRRILFFAILLIFCFAGNSYSWGITGGTTRGGEVRKPAHRDPVPESEMRDEMYGKIEKWGNRVAPKAGTATKRLMQGMEWSADQQRRLGGVPPTGATTKGNN